MNTSKILLLFLLMFVSLPFVEQASAWTIDEVANSVYINDADVYLSASPHTIAQSQWVYFTLIPKTYNGDIDAVWGFNTSTTRPKKAELYFPHWVNTTYSQSHTFYNVTIYNNYTNQILDYGNSYNTYKIVAVHEVPTYDNNFTINGTKFIMSNVSFDSYTQSGNNYTVTWHTRQDNYVLWKDMTNSFDSVIHNYEGYDKWYFIKDASVTVGNIYTVRAWIDVPISTTPQQGKYYFAIKPSFEDIPTAIANGHFYALDPWWNSSWMYKINNILPDNVRPFQYSLNISNATGTNNATHIYCNGHCNVNFTDIRFTLDNTTPLSYWIEDNATGKVWVNVTANGTVNMYYGNPSATSASNGENTFDFFDDFDVGSIDLNKWDGSTSATSISNGILTLTGQGTAQTIRSIKQFGNNVALRSRCLIGTGGADEINIFGLVIPDVTKFAEFYRNYLPQNIIYNKNGGSSTETNTNLPLNTMFIGDIQIVGGSSVSWKFNGTAGTGSPISSNVPDATTLEVYANSRITGGGTGVQMDWVLIRQYTATEPTWATWGAEESQPLTYSGASHNQTTAGLPTLFSIQYTDETALHPNGQWIFSTNNTGEWVNDSAVNWTATPEWANVTKTLNSTGGIIIGYRWYVSDNAGNTNNTPIYTVETVDITSPMFISGLTSTTGNFYHNWTWTNPTDADFNYTSLYINGTWIVNTSDQYYNLTANAHNVSTISTRTVDTSGNVNSTWVNHTSSIPNNNPSYITLLTPTNGSTVTSIPVNFTWNAGTDLDSDNLTYDLRVNGSTVSTGIIVNYILYSLVSGANNWSVRSYDGYNYSAWSSVYDITYSEESATRAVIPSYGGGGSGWAIESLNKTILDTNKTANQIISLPRIDMQNLYIQNTKIINFLLFLMFSLIIMLFISTRPLPSVVLSLIIYIIYGIVTGTHVLIETTPIISILITSVVFSLVSTTVVQIMNKL